MIDMDVLQQFGLSTDFSTQQITSRTEQWHLSLQFRHNHAYILHEEILFSTSYTKPELLKLHKHFMHPSPGKETFSSAQSLKTWNIKPNNLQNTAGNFPCVRNFCPIHLSPSPIPYHHSPRRKFLSQRTCHWLNVHKKGTSCCRYCNKFSKRNLYQIKVNGWPLARFYNMLGSCIHIISAKHQTGPQIFLTSASFRQNSKDIVVDLQFSDIESHNAIVQGERYHYPLCRIFNITSEEQLRLPDAQILRLAIKAINDTKVPDELVPYLLLCVVILGLHRNSRSQFSGAAIFCTMCKTPRTARPWSAYLTF